MKKFNYILYLFSLFFIFIFPISASKGMLIQNSVKLCSDGNLYGYHNKNGEKHYHVALKNDKGNYVAKDETSLGNKNPCNDEIKNESKTGVTLYKCVDGDTAKVKINGKIKTIRFLAVDTPETKHPKKGEEPYGKEASEYTCNSLKQAKNIRLEYDSGSEKTDKYDRDLVWIFTDEELLQKNLIEKGLAKVAYLYGDYKYTDELKNIEKEAKKDKVGVWSDKKEETKYPLFLVIPLIVISLVLKLVLKK